MPFVLNNVFKCIHVHRTSFGRANEGSLKCIATGHESSPWTEGLVRTLFGGDTDGNTEGKYFNYLASGLR